MARVLAIESDPSQAAALEQIIREHVGAEAVLADSKEAAIAAIAEAVPDLIIVSALLSPRDESELANYLRALDGAEHVQILTIPQLVVANPVKPTRASGGLLRAFKRKRAKTTPVACDPDRYGDVLKGYLKLSVEARTERVAQRARDERTRQRTEAVRAAEATRLLPVPAGVDLVAAAATYEPDSDLPVLADEIIRPYERAPFVEELFSAATDELDIDVPAVPAVEIIRPYVRAAPYVEEAFAAAEVDAPSERPAWLLPKPVEIEVMHRAVEAPIVELPASDDSATSDTAMNEYVAGLAAASDGPVAAPLDEPDIDVPAAMAAEIVQPLELAAPYVEEVLAAAEVEAPIDVPAVVTAAIVEPPELAAPYFEEMLAATEVEALIDVPAAVAAEIVQPLELAAPHVEEVLPAAEVEAPIDVPAAVAVEIAQPFELAAPYFQEMLAATAVEAPSDVHAAAATIVELPELAAPYFEEMLAATEVEALTEVPAAVAAEPIQPLELAAPYFEQVLAAAEVEAQNDVPAAVAAEPVQPLELATPNFEEVLAATEVEVSIDVPAGLTAETIQPFEQVAPDVEETLAAAELEVPVDVLVAPAEEIVQLLEMAAPNPEEVLAAAEVEISLDVSAALTAKTIQPLEQVAPDVEETLAAAELEVPVDVLVAPAEEIVQLLTPAAADVEDAFAAAEVEAAIDVPAALAEEIVQPLEMAAQFVERALVAEVEAPIVPPAWLLPRPVEIEVVHPAIEMPASDWGLAASNTVADEFVAGPTPESDAARLPVTPDLSEDVEFTLENILEDAPSLEYRLHAETPALDRLPTEPWILFAAEPPEDAPATTFVADTSETREPLTTSAPAERVVTDPETRAASDIAIDEIAVEVIALPSFGIAVESNVLDAGTTLDLETAASPVGVDDRAATEPEIAATPVAVASPPSDLDAFEDQSAPEPTPMTAIELGPEAVSAVLDEPKPPVHDFMRALLRPLPAFCQPAEEPLAAMEEDRIALSATSFEIDRRESDDYLLVAVREPARATRPVEPAGPPDPLHGAQSAEAAPFDRKTVAEVTEQSATRRKKARKRKRIHDEHGVVHPSPTSVDGVLAALQAETQQGEAQEAEENSDAWQSSDTPPQASPLHAPREPRPRLAPLSMWAHSVGGSSDSRPTEDREQDYLRELLSGLDIPPHIAAVSYPTGCRIRRVRMVKGPNGRRAKPKANEPVVILSRRALGRTTEGSGPGPRGAPGRE